MKKIIGLLAAILVLGVTSCGSDDDGAKNECKECAVVVVNFKICNNGNNTANVTTTTVGIENTSVEEFDEGQTFDEFVAEKCPLNFGS